MLYTEDFTMHHYVGFSQIGSPMCGLSLNFYKDLILPSAVQLTVMKHQLYKEKVQ